MFPKEKPMFKWPGGKSREIKIISNYISSDTTSIIEPFVGGGAVFLSSGIPAQINDNDPSIVNFYEVIKDSELFPQLMSKVEIAKKIAFDKNLTKKESRTTSGNLCNEYYLARDFLNSSDRVSNKVEWAYSFLIVRQLCFSGMHRTGSKNNFNVPFGWYKKFHTKLNNKHHEIMKNVGITNGPFEDVFKQKFLDTDFIFLDPPYLDRAGYTDKSGSINLDLHELLFSKLVQTNARWLIVHCDHEFYRDRYKNYFIHEGDFNYSQNFRGRDASGNKVSHLYISNVDIRSFGNGLFEMS